MNLDLVYHSLIAASQLFLLGWTGILVTACVITFRETPARSAVPNSRQMQR